MRRGTIVQSATDTIDFLSADADDSTALEIRDALNRFIDQNLSRENDVERIEELVSELGWFEFLKGVEEVARREADDHANSLDAENQVKATDIARRIHRIARTYEN